MFKNGKKMENNGKKKGEIDMRLANFHGIEISVLTDADKAFKFIDTLYLSVTCNRSVVFSGVLQLPPPVKRTATI